MNLNILFEDEHLLVLHKPAGVPVQSARVGAQDCESLLKNYLCRGKAGQGAPYLGIVHRLDQPVEGLLVFAKTAKAAANLSRQAAGKEMEKIYLALCQPVDNACPQIHSGGETCGKPRSFVENSVDKWEELVDFLRKNPKTNRAEIVSAAQEGAKRAALRYRVFGEEGGRLLLEIRLETGRFHQIRAQLSAHGMPIVGDRKYGPAKPAVDFVENAFPALCAYRLAFRHPATGKRLEFTSYPQNPAFQGWLSTEISTD